MTIKDICSLIKSKSVRDISLVYIGNLFFAGFGFVASVLLARFLSPDQLGYYALFLSFSLILTEFMDLGLRNAVIQNACFFMGKEGKESSFKIIKVSFLLKIILGVIVSLLGLVFYKSKLIACFYADKQIPFLFLYSIGLATTTSFFDFHKAILQLLKKFKSMSLLPIINQIFFILFFILIFLYKGDLQLNAIIIIKIGAVLAALGLSLFFINWKEIFGPSLNPEKNNVRTNKSIIKEIFHFSKWLLLANVIFTLFEKIDIFMLKYFNSSQEVGYYFAAQRVIILFTMIGTAITTVCFPKMAELSGGNDLEPLRDLFVKISNFSAAIAIPVGFGLASIAREVILLLYGNKYISSVPILLSLVPYCIIFILCDNAGGLLLSIGHPELIAVDVFIMLIFNFVGNYLLIPRWGAVGAGIATSFTQLSNIIFVWYFISKKLKAMPRVKPIFGYMMASAIMYLVIRSVNLSTIILVNLLIKIISAIIIFLVLNYFIQLFLVSFSNFKGKD
ncbi:MAG: flippase [bacterium]